MALRSVISRGRHLLYSLPWVVGSRSLNYAQTVPRPLSLITASSGISKGNAFPQITKTNMTPKWSFGDDAYFVAKCLRADVIGVADGVGGWREYGIDPSQFPKTLMSVCERLVKEGLFEPQKPKDIISKGYEEIQEYKEEIAGSCTACLVVLDREARTLYSANLGDSGFIVIRDGRVVHRSREQQHYFNAPFQLAYAPAVLDGTVLSDSPDSADTDKFAVQVGDIIVVATDGLFDNMNDDMILQHTSALKGSDQSSVQLIANALAQTAHRLGNDTQYMSPFAKRASEFNLDFVGGKPDDITVIVALVTEDGVVTS